MTQDFGTEGRGSKPCVLIYTHSLLDKSMTFILSHAQALARHEPFYVGAHRSESSLELPPGQYATANQGGASGKLHEYVFRRFGHAPRFFEKLAARKPVLVHAHFGTSGPNGLSIAEHLGIPLIITFHGKDATMTPREAASNLRGREYLRHRSRLIEKCDCVIAVSDYIRQRVIEQGFRPERVLVHRNGIDTDFFRPSPMEREPMIVFVGRFVEKKGAEYLLQALKIMRDRNVPAQAVLIGDGPLRPHLEALTQAAGLDVQFTGFLPLEEVRTWLNRAAVVAVPSVVAANGDSEGLPTVVLEAQAMATPVVATRHSGIPEGVVEGRTALLVDERDVGALADALASLLTDPAKARSLGEAAQIFIRANFSIRSQVDGLESIYEDACASEHP